MFRDFVENQGNPGFSCRSLRRDLDSGMCLDTDDAFLVLQKRTMSVSKRTGHSIMPVFGMARASN